MPAEIFEPAIDSKPGNGPADKIGDHNQAEKLFGEHGIHIGDSGPVNPSYADLFGLAFHHK